MGRAKRRGPVAEAESSPSPKRQRGEAKRTAVSSPSTSARPKSFAWRLLLPWLQQAQQDLGPDGKIIERELNFDAQAEDDDAEDDCHTAHVDSNRGKRGLGQSAH